MSAIGTSAHRVTVDAPRGALGVLVGCKPHLLKASIDYSGYDPIVAKALADPFVGGSTACHAAVKAAFTELSRMMDDVTSGGGRSKLEHTFATCGAVVTDLDCECLCLSSGGSNLNLSLHWPDPSLMRSSVKGFCELPRVNCNVTATCDLPHST
jgi:hypothetical protein